MCVCTHTLIHVYLYLFHLFCIKYSLLFTGEGNGNPLQCSCLYSGDSLVAQMVKNLHAVQERQVLPLGWKDPLEKRMAPLQILARRIPWTKEPGKL